MMKVKDLITKLQKVNPESNIQLHIKQYTGMEGLGGSYYDVLEGALKEIKEKKNKVIFMAGE